MKGIFSKILISFFMLGIFLVPVSISLKLNNEKNLVFEPRLQIAHMANPDIDPELVKKYTAEAKAESDSICTVNPTTWFTGCIVQLFVEIFELLAGLAKYPAKILDYFIKYSITSDSYTGTFIQAAWGTVRDVANIFFLLGLLYVAIQIVLDIHVSEKKKMIGQIIVMALLVNFSLFATQVVIDASNIMARVFYNQIESKNEYGQTIDKNSNKPKSITVSLISVFNPQSIIADKNAALGSYFLVVIISIIIILYMIFLFLSVAFLFVGRVVSLWVAMIFAPIAFMSRGLGITSLEELSWKNWLHNLMSSAIMAPIFIFFLYIILLLGKNLTSLSLDLTSNNSGVDSIMRVVIPFAMLFIMLTKAKSLAVKYSGDIGQMVSKIGTAAVVGGAALATGGLAFAGRNVVGRTLARATKGETLSQRVADGNTTGLNKVQLALGKFGQRIGLDKGFGKNSAGNGVDTGIGGLINKKQKTLKEVDHAKHEIADLKKKAGFEGKQDWELSATQLGKVKDQFYKEKKGDFESMVRRGTDGKKPIELLDDKGNGLGVYGEDEFRKTKRADKQATMLADASAEARGDVVFDKKSKKKIITNQGREKISDEINLEFGKSLKKTTEVLSENKYKHLKNESIEKVSMFDRVTASSTGSSYDIKNFAPDPSKVSGWWGANKVVVGLLAAIALSLRSGLKATNLNPGKGTGDFMNDLSEILTNAMKGMNAKIDLGHKKDDHGGGDHGGGHH